MLKILKNKKGITLVELIVGMVVLAIILATVSAILFPMMRFQSRANELAEQNALLDDLANQIVYDLSMAIPPIPPTPPLGNVTLPGGGEMVIPIAASNGGNVVYTIVNGVIWRSQSGENNPLLPEEFHMRMNATGLSVDTVELRLNDDAEGTVFTLTLTLSNADTEFQRPYAVRPLALN